MKCLKLDVKKPSSPNISKCPLTANSGLSAQTKLVNSIGYNIIFDKYQLLIAYISNQ